MCGRINPEGVTLETATWQQSLMIKYKHAKDHTNPVGMLLINDVWTNEP